MTERPPLFDRLAQRRFSARAAAGGLQPFLHGRAAEEIAARLSAIRREFGIAAISASTRADLPALRGIAARQVTLGREVVGDLDRLPFAAASLDLAVSVLDLSAIDDVPGTLVQLRRALRPDGLFLGVLLGGRSLTELRQSLAAAEAELRGGASPRIAPMIDVRDAGALLQRAGFALPVADSEVLTVRYATPRALMHDLRGMGLGNALAARSRRPMRRAVLERAEALYRQRFGLADGRVPASFELIALTGWAPHDSQQKPAPRGSATVSLADALKPRDGG